MYSSIFKFIFLIYIEKSHSDGEDNRIICDLIWYLNHTSWHILKIMLQRPNHIMYFKITNFDIILKYSNGS